MLERTAQYITGRRGAQEPDRRASTQLFRLLALAHALYYVLTGIWSLVSIRTFQQVTGPKTDLWLVKTVGVLVSVIGGVLGLAGWRRQLAPEIPLLAVGSAAGLAAIDVVYVARKRIAPIYLLDALGELALIAAWALVWPRARRERFRVRRES